MSIQTTYPFTRTEGYPGGLADDGPRRIKTVIAAEALTPGLFVARGASPEKGYALTAPDAADPDGIITAGASAATVQTLSGASLDGVIGEEEMFPPRNLVLVLSSHANWDLTVATVTGTDEDGNVIQEDFRIPDAGNATVTGVKLFSKVTSIYIPAQSGTSGTFTLGTGSKLGKINGKSLHGLALYDASREPGTYAAAVPTPVVEQGRVFVTSETSYDDGDPVYVRLVISGNEVRGHVRNSPDSNDCALLAGATFRRKGSAGVATIDLSL